MSKVCVSLWNLTLVPRGTRMWRSLPEPADHSAYVGAYAITAVLASSSESRLVRSVSPSVFGSSLAFAKNASIDVMTSDVLDANSADVGTQLPMLVIAAATPVV